MKALQHLGLGKVAAIPQSCWQLHVAFQKNLLGTSHPLSNQILRASQHKAVLSRDLHGSEWWVLEKRKVIAYPQTEHCIFIFELCPSCYVADHASKKSSKNELLYSNCSKVIEVIFVPAPHTVQHLKLSKSNIEGYKALHSSQLLIIEFFCSGMI